LLRPDEAGIKVALLESIKATNVTAAGLPHDIDVQLLDTAAHAIRFGDFSFDLNITLTARSVTAPDEPPKRIGGLQSRVRFVNQPTVRLTIAKGHITIPDALLVDFDLARVNVTIRAAAFPGLNAVEDLSVDMSS